MVLQLKKWTLDLPINRKGALVAVVLFYCVFGVVVADGAGEGLRSDLEEISHFPHVTVNLTAEKGYNNHGSFDIHRKFPVEAGPQEEGKIDVDAIGHINISDVIKNGELSTIFCERCTYSQKQKVEQILYLLSNFNNNNGVSSTSKDSAQKEYVLRKNKRNKNRQFKRKFSTTNSPVLQHWKNLPEMIPTPEILSSSHHPRNPISQVIQLPTLSSTTPTTSSSTYSSMAIPIVPYFYSASAPTSPLPSSVATTLSSALEPSQSVEMPTPPMPPTTTGPIYLYYLGSQSSLSSSGSLEPPTTPVVESSLSAFASSNPSIRN